MPVSHTRSFGLGGPGAWFVFVSPVAFIIQSLYYPVLPTTHTHTQTHTALVHSCMLFYSCSFCPKCSHLLPYLHDETLLSFRAQLRSSPTLTLLLQVPLFVWQYTEHLMVFTFSHTLLSSLPDCKALKGQNYAFFILLFLTNLSQSHTQWILTNICKIKLTWIFRTNFKSKCSL